MCGTGSSTSAETRMLAAQVVSRVNRGFGVGLTMRDLFEAPSPADFAQVVVRAIEQRPHAPGAEPTLTGPVDPALIDGVSDVDDPAALLARLDSMSDDEIDRLFARLAGADNDGPASA